MMMRIQRKRVLVGTLVLSLALLFISNEVVAVSCECPGGDPFEDKGCAPVPAKVDKRIFSKECLLPASPLTPDLDHFIKTARHVAVMKNDRDILDYTHCFRRSDKTFCHFKESVGPLIQLSSIASQSKILPMGLPFPVQACLFKKESEFDLSSVSKMKAVSYIQAMPDTLKDIDRILEKSAEEYQSELETKTLELKAIEEEQAKVLKGTRNFFSFSAKISRQKHAITDLRKDMLARQVWDNYWQYTENAPKRLRMDYVTFKKSVQWEKAHRKTNPDFPSKHASDPLIRAVQCPQIAFAASAVKQISDLLTMVGDDEFNAIMDRKPEAAPLKKADPSQSLIKKFQKMTAQEQALVLAGAYNAGVAGFDKICHTDEKNPAEKHISFKECFRRVMMKGGETYKHMKGIKDCSTNDVWNPANKDNRECKPKDRCD